MQFPVLISIRNKATRLPGKSFATILGRPAVELLATRLATCEEPGGIVICTSVNPDDDVFEDVASRLGIGIFRGSEDDKLTRYLACARRLEARFVVVVDGDDLLCDPGGIDRLIAHLRAQEESGERPDDFVICGELPLGATGFAVRTEALADVCARKRESDTEVWGGYFADDPSMQSRELPPADPALARPEFRLTLDYLEDLEVIGAVYEAAGRADVPLAEVVSILDARPELAGHNADAHERYLAHLARSPRADWAPVGGSE